ncbi:deoxyguanosinetriphosphate triphosphohydrolase [Planosporangium flavigriseum]|uniref:Deoxyguanosinetriphosphate triphosphohydrolase-like protein n=1 Tax=Planosporangium flavigriseum TaxID=373681 RepID=A0A8J3LYJ9_9ACTN|nr:deoxyguanosinetriphosphate triphosphohydrolase [Planosporangium flavigriseum]NJC67140.1 deoxyguanosinetriphosphate triphosphohydrolase [Planosporangium flavigriseum]GIG75745.1 deoxyguanosinetriphosphate triphosphohydrolase-like protein [Planosporangium flavigriseum]
MNDHDAERYVRETAKDPLRPVDAGWRSPFQRDRARVLHSAAFRRLATKTQVHTAGGDEFLRTRLTHSLEVAQIAREMGERLGCDPDIVDTAGLAHDLGHPPFGHTGEEVLDAVAQACGGFEGNAQTLRVLTSLEAKIVDDRGESAGLNLTRASLDAVAKYPWFREPGKRKFGAYAEDAAVFDWLRDGTPDHRRCLEAQVMDWADDVAYSVHDVEDGVYGGYVPFARLRKDPDERAALCADVAATYSTESTADLAAVLEELIADPLFDPLSHYDGSHTAQVGLKRVTSVLTGRFIAGAVSATRERYGGGPLGRYAGDLVVPRRIRAQCALLKGLAFRYVMRRGPVAAWRDRQQEILRELVAALTVRAPDALDPVFAPRWRAAADDAARLRVVIDQVASLTDPAAVDWHRRFVG